MPEESKEQLDDAVEPHVRAWEFKGDETLHPFWAVERLTEEERRKAQKGAFTLKCEGKEFAAVTVGSSGDDSIAITLGVNVPIMTNAVDVKQGQELFLESTAQKEKKRKEVSWKADVGKVAKPRTAPDPKGSKPRRAPAGSLEIVTEI